MTTLKIKQSGSWTPIAGDVTPSNPINDWIAYNTPTAWVAPPLSNGWVNFSTDRLPRYRKIGDIVYLEGCIKNGTLGYGTHAVTLPAGFRPQWDNTFVTSMSGGLSNVFVHANGGVSISAGVGGTNAFVYLNSMWQAYS